MNNEHEEGLNEVPYAGQLAAGFQAADEEASSITGKYQKGSGDLQPVIEAGIQAVQHQVLAPIRNRSILGLQKIRDSVAEMCRRYVAGQERHIAGYKSIRDVADQTFINNAKAVVIAREQQLGEHENRKTQLQREITRAEDLAQGKVESARAAGAEMVKVARNKFRLKSLSITGHPDGYVEKVDEGNGWVFIIMAAIVAVELLLGYQIVKSETDPVMAIIISLGLLIGGLVLDYFGARWMALWWSRRVARKRLKAFQSISSDVEVHEVQVYNLPALTTILAWSAFALLQALLLGMTVYRTIPVLKEHGAGATGKLIGTALLWVLFQVLFLVKLAKSRTTPETEETALENARKEVNDAVYRADRQTGDAKNQADEDLDDVKDRLTEYLTNFDHSSKVDPFEKIKGEYTRGLTDALQLLLTQEQAIHQMLEDFGKLLKDHDAARRAVAQTVPHFLEPLLVDIIQENSADFKTEIELQHDMMIDRATAVFADGEELAELRRWHQTQVVPAESAKLRPGVTDFEPLISEAKAQLAKQRADEALQAELAEEERQRRNAPAPEPPVPVRPTIIVRGSSRNTSSPIALPVRHQN